jgi:hypothetical protein
MPKAAMHENCCAMPRQNNIGLSRKFSPMQPKSEAEFMQHRPHTQLWCGVCSLDRGHVSASLLASVYIGHAAKALV